MKKIIITITLALAIIGTTFAASSNFTDQNSFADWYKDAVSSLASKGVITGYPDGSFRPGNTVNRAQLAVILERFDDRMRNMINNNASDLQLAYSQDIARALYAYEDFSDYDIDQKYRIAITMANAGVGAIGKVTLKEDDYGTKLSYEENGASYTYDVELVSDDTFPHSDNKYSPYSYDVYEEPVYPDEFDRPHFIFVRYTRWTGFGGFCGDCNAKEISTWYGPFDF